MTCVLTKQFKNDICRKFQVIKSILIALIIVIGSLISFIIVGAAIGYISVHVFESCPGIVANGPWEYYSVVGIINMIILMFGIILSIGIIGILFILFNISKPIFIGLCNLKDSLKRLKDYVFICKD